MALPTLDKTWNFSVNNIYPSGNSGINPFRDLWFYMVGFFISNGWTAVASCRDNTGAGSSFSAGFGNLWISPINLTWSASPASPRSWIVLRHPVNNSEILISLVSISGMARPDQTQIFFSRSGFNISTPVTNPASPIASNVSGDTITLFDLSGSGSLGLWGVSGNLDQRFVRHSMCSTDGYSMRHIIYCQDYPVFGFFIETPKEPVINWAPSRPTPSAAMVFNSGGLLNCLTTAVYTTTPLRTRFGTDGGTAANLSLYLSGESYSTNLLTNGLNVPNDFTGEYPMIPMGIISTTGPFRGKLGKMSDLWFGISNFLGPVAYPGDSSRQFAQHGTIITPWNGSNIVTR